MKALAPRRWLAQGLAALSTAGCAVQLEPGWEDALSEHLADRRALFAGSERILSGHADLTSDDLAAGDEALFGVCLDVHGHQRVWYLHLSVLDVKTKRWLWYRPVHPYETRLQRPPDHDQRVARDLANLASDMPVARIQVEVFDAAGRSQGRASSELAVEQLMIGMRPACIAGRAQRELMRGRVALGEEAEVLQLEELTAEQRRDLDTVGGGIGACEGFFQVLRANPITRDLLDEVVARPTLWSVITHFGVRADVTVDFFAARPVPPDRFPEVSTDLWSFPLTIRLNAQPALLTRVVVGPRGAPNAVAAGVYAVHGRHPTDPQRRLHLQVLATRRNKGAGLDTAFPSRAARIQPNLEHSDHACEPTSTLGASESRFSKALNRARVYIGVPSQRTNRPGRTAPCTSPSRSATPTSPRSRASRPRTSSACTSTWRAGCSSTATSPSTAATSSPRG